MDSVHGFDIQPAKSYETGGEGPTGHNQRYADLNIRAARQTDLGDEVQTTQIWAIQI